MRNQPKPNFRITEIHAFTAIGEDTEEGIVAYQMGGTYMPLVSADLDRLHQLRVIAQSVANELGITISISKFTVREEVGTIVPFPNKAA